MFPTGLWADPRDLEFEVLVLCIVMALVDAGIDVC